MVERLFLAVPRACLRIVIVVFPDHTHLLFLIVQYLAASDFNSCTMVNGDLVHANKFCHVCYTTCVVVAVGSIPCCPSLHHLDFPFACHCIWTLY